ncbi:MAG: hypothetical protein WCL14_10950 [Bacteroidota bacterium]
MKKITNFIFIAVVMIITTISVSAQTIDASIKYNYGFWSLVNGTNNYPNKNMIYDSLALEPAVDGSTMCTLFLKNSSNHCKHLIITYSYTTSDGQLNNKSLDLLVNPGQDKYINNTDGTYDRLSFNAMKITEPFKIQLFEDSGKCR